MSAPSTATAGSAFSATVYAENAVGYVVTGHTGAGQFTSPVRIRRRSLRPTTPLPRRITVGTLHPQRQNQPSDTVAGQRTREKGEHGVVKERLSVRAADKAKNVASLESEK